MAERRPIEDIQALLAEGLELGVETRELVRLQQCVRHAQELQNKLAAFDYCEEQMELRSLKGILNEMERIPVVLEEEQTVRSRWSQSNAWLERAKAILSSPRRTRKGKQDVQGDNMRQRYSLTDVDALVQQAAMLPLVSNRIEARDLADLVRKFITWQEQVRSQITRSDEASPADADQQQQEAHEKLLNTLLSLVEQGSQFPIQCQESAGLALMVWTCRAQMATGSKTTLKDLVELCDKAKAIGAPDTVLLQVRAKRKKAEDWVKKAKVALAKKLKAADCKMLLQEAVVLEVDSDEAFLIEYQLEAAESWTTRVQVQLALPLDDSDYRVKNLKKSQLTLLFKMTVELTAENIWLCCWMFRTPRRSRRC